MRQDKKKRGSREGSFSLLDIFALGRGTGLPTEVNGDAHEKAALVEKVARDVHTEEKQDEDYNEDAHDGSGAQT